MSQPADLLIAHALCFTADPINPSAEAVALTGNRIVFVGSAADARAWIGPRTRVIDARRRTLMPGFIDSHTHLLAGSLELADAQLSDAKTLDGLSSALRAFAQEHADREWLIGRGLSYGIKPDRSSLTRHDLDAILADRPLIVYAYDAHTAWANTVALKRGGILRGGAVGPNSEIVMAHDGLAAGELRESASDPIERVIPPPTDADKRGWLRKGLRLAAEHGVTSVHIMNGNADDLALYAAMDDLGELTLRVVVPYSVAPDTPIEALTEAAKLRERCRSDRVRGGSVKLFMDGVIESYTALLLDEYADRPGYLGDANFSAEHFNRMAIEADRLGLQIAVHAIGDAAVRRTLDGFEAAQRANGVRDSRHRVEHIELIHPDDAPRFAQLGVIASMQPLHAPKTADDLDLWPMRVGPSRWDRSFAWRTLQESGARLVFGSDWPVVSLDSMRGVHAALNRSAWREGGIDHRQTLADTLIAYTRDAAYAEFQDQFKGRLHVGLLADMVLLSEDIFSIPAESIDRVRSILTVCDGRIVHEMRETL